MSAARSSTSSSVDGGHGRGLDREAAVHARPARRRDGDARSSGSRRRSPHRRLLHGSTVVLNALLQERGATVGLITTPGFRDVLELGRGNRPDIYDWLVTPPDPLVPRHLRREVPERLGAPTAPSSSRSTSTTLDREVDELVARRRGGRRRSASCTRTRTPRTSLRRPRRIRERHPGLPVTLVRRRGAGVAGVRADVDRRPERVRPAARSDATSTTSADRLARRRIRRGRSR